MMEVAWKHILHSLERSLSAENFSVWIKPLQGNVSGKNLVLTAPNKFVAQRVQDRLYRSVREAAVEVLGAEARVKVVVGKREAGKKHRRAETAPVRATQLGLPIIQRQSEKTPNWRFSFDDFVVGPSNELACAASKGLCHDSIASDHLLLCSGPGLGKTHLLHSIGRELCVSANRRPNVACLSAEEFANRWIMSFKSKRVDEFKRQFRQDVDVLLLEDIHFFQGKHKMQDEFLSTLKALNDRGSKVVLTSTFLPRELKDVDERLASRFCSGLLANITCPDLETRRRIIRDKARRMQVDVPVDVTDLMAERITADIRQLESCLQNLVLKAKLLNRTVSMEMAWDVLEQYAIENPKPGFENIIEFICRYYGISDVELKSKSRKRRIVQARDAAFFLARKHTDLSLKCIGERLGRRHSTVLKGITKVEREMSLKTPAGCQLSNIINTMKV